MSLAGPSRPRSGSEITNITGPCGFQNRYMLVLVAVSPGPRNLPRRSSALDSTGPLEELWFEANSSCNWMLTNYSPNGESSIFQSCHNPLQKKQPLLCDVICSKA